MNIVFLGYYGHNNYGDDYFEYIFKKIFLNYKVSFYNPNKITNLSESTNIIICGGGDIINDYFMKQIIKLKYNLEDKVKKKIPTYAISIGITFKKSFYDNKPYYLDIFDYFIVRNKIDKELLDKRYDPEYVKYLPDIVHGIIKYKRKYIIQPICKEKVIGIFLTNTISNSGTNLTYNDEIKKFAELIQTIPKEYKIHLVPFNTGPNKNENDNELNKNIYNLLNAETRKNVFVKHYSLKDLLNTFRNQIYSFGICMRYHAHILCNTYNIPFISISMTNKTFEYMVDFGLDNYYINYNDRVLNIENIIELIETGITDKVFKNQKQSKIINLNDFTYPVTNLIIRTKGPEYFDIDRFNKFFNMAMKDLLEYLFKDENQTELINIFIENWNLSDIYKYLKINIPIDEAKNITNFVIFKIFNTFHTEYNYGLEEKIFNCNLKDNILWIYENKSYKGHKSNFINISNNIKLNFNFIDNTFKQDIHRSGWNYVSQQLINKYHNLDSNLIVDLYVDKTFLWEENIYKNLKKIPYIKSWIGFIHHTPDPNYTNNSLNNILKSETFLLSLKKCKCLIVLSNYLRNYLLNVCKLKVNIYTLTHPTESILADNIFTFNKFKKNKNKKVIQIGGWLRNSYAIYELPLNYKKLDIKKYILQGREMENYVKPEKFSHYDLLNSQNKDYNIINNRICYATTNKYIEGLINHLSVQYNDVTIIKYLDNNKYDNILSENIVFINLINVSACNTLIECVMRNTPIIINRLEGVEEIVGSEYPLFYDNIVEAGEIITDINKIKKGYEYLVKLDKTKLKIETFLDDFENIIKLIT